MSILEYHLLVAKPVVANDFNLSLCEQIAICVTKSNALDLRHIGQRFRHMFFPLRTLTISGTESVLSMFLLFR